MAESFDRKKLEELLRLTYPPGTVRDRASCHPAILSCTRTHPLHVFTASTPHSTPPHYPTPPRLLCVLLLPLLLPLQIRSFPDVFYVEYIKGAEGQPGGDVFFFDYGVVACWGED